MTAARIAGGSTRGRFDVLHLHEPRDAQRRRCSRCGPPTARSSRRSTPPTSARGPCRRPTRCCARRWRRSTPGSPSPRTPAAPSSTHIGGDAGASSRTASTSTGSPRRAAAAVAGHAQAPTVAFLGRIDEPRKGLPVLLAGAAAGAARPSRACGCWSPAAVTRRPRERWPADVAAAVEFLGGVERRGQGRPAALGRRVRRAAHRRRELRHRAGRGDERRCAGRGQRPGGASPRSWTAAARARCSAPATPRPGRRVRRRCSRDPAGAARCAAAPAPAVRPLRLVGRRGRGAWRSTRRSPRRAAHAPTAERPRVAPAGARRPDGGRVVKDAVGWVALVVACAALIAWYLSYTAARLDRIHARVEGALSALDAQLRTARRGHPRAGQRRRCSTRPARCCSPVPPRSRWRPATSTTPAARRSRATSPTSLPARLAPDVLSALRDDDGPGAARPAPVARGQPPGAAGPPVPQRRRHRRPPRRRKRRRCAGSGWPVHAEMPRTFEIDDELTGWNARR